MSKEIPYFIDQNIPLLPIHRIQEKMRGATIVVILGDKKTYSMEIEELVARGMKKPIFYRPDARTLAELKNGELFPKHQRR